MSELEVVPESEILDETKKSIERESEEARVKKMVDEIKAANEEYQKLDKALREKRLEVEKLQSDAYTALQRATAMNEKFNMNVNAQLMRERDKLKDEVEKLRVQFEKSFKAKSAK